MICLSGNLPALKIGHHHVVGYKTDWIEEALSRAAAASNRTDCPFIPDIRDGILHYLEKRCSLRVFAIEDLYSRMRAMLRRIGCDDIAQHLCPLAPPITVSLIGPARKAGRGSESDFFRSLGEEIRLLQKSGAESICLCNIDESVTLLRGPDASVVSRAQLRIEITLFVESYQRRHPAPNLELDLTFDS